MVQASQVRLANQFLKFERLGQSLLGTEASKDRDKKIQVRTRFWIHNSPPNLEYRPRLWMNRTDVRYPWGSLGSRPDSSALRRGTMGAVVTFVGMDLPAVTHGSKESWGRP